MIVPQQIQVKLTDLANQKHQLVYKKQIYEQEVEQIGAAIEVINGAVFIYKEWLSDLLTEQTGKKEAEKPLSDLTDKKENKTNV